MRLLTLTRRSTLAACAAWLSTRSAGAAVDYEVRDLVIPGDPKLATRFTLLVPRHTTDPVPLLIAFHGKGETIDEKTGAYAWVDGYGLTSCYERLLRPPVVATETRARFWDQPRLKEINDALAAKPFGGIAVACPYTPDFFKAMDRVKMLDDYADWIVREVIPRARREARVLPGAANTGLDGVSLGGYVGLELFLRKPEQFGAWGSVQGAFGSHRVRYDYPDRLKETLARVGPRKLHLLTSTSDTYREENEAMHKRLVEIGVTHDYLTPPGAHTTPFLKDTGTLEMLFWHERALRS
jgi:pimeloyl-ACP methyl ester carboxylesterase